MSFHRGYFYCDECGGKMFNEAELLTVKEGVDYKVIESGKYEGNFAHVECLDKLTPER